MNMFCTVNAKAAAAKSQCANMFAIPRVPDTVARENAELDYTVQGRQ